MTFSRNRDHRLRQSTGVPGLACAILAAGLFAAAPAIVEVIDYLRFSGAPGVTFVSRWALLVLWISMLQAAYGLYLILWSDRAAVWSVAISLLVHAAIYALTLGVILINGANGILTANIGLQPGGNSTTGQVALWCVCMVSLWTLMTFFAGRLALSWRRAESLARQTMRHST